MRRLLVLLCCVALAGCATHWDAARAAEPYGFLWGIWHGAIWSFALIGVVISWLFSLVGVDFLSSIELVGRPNTGFGYWAGFVIGFLCFGGSAAGGR